MATLVVCGGVAAAQELSAPLAQAPVESVTMSCTHARNDILVEFRGYHPLQLIRDADTGRAEIGGQRCKVIAEYFQDSAGAAA